MRFGPQELDPYPRPHTNEHAVNQQLNDIPLNGETIGGVYGSHLLRTTTTPEVDMVVWFILSIHGVKTQWPHNSHRLDHMLLQVLVHFQTHFLEEWAWREVRRQVTSVPSDGHLQSLKHINKTTTWLDSVVIVLSMSVVGPLLVSVSVGGEANTLGPGGPTCVDREVFSSNEFFSITTSRDISITTSFSLLSFFDLHSFSSDLHLWKVFEKKKISGGG
jgi:hypothetical protein